MSARSFADTNVLAYAFDDGSPDKRDRARDLLGDEELTLIISAQVIGEFYAVVTRKLTDPLSDGEAAEEVDRFLRLPVVPIDGELTRSAIATSRTNQISYWDALIVEAAAAARCDVLLSEDLNAGQTIRGIRVENPFL